MTDQPAESATTCEHGFPSAHWWPEALRCQGPAHDKSAPTMTTNGGRDMAKGSRYGSKVDELIDRWAVLENEHDKHHADRSQCGGVGRCTMMRAGHLLEEEIIDALVDWRRQSS